MLKLDDQAAAKPVYVVLDLTHQINAGDTASGRISLQRHLVKPEFAPQPGPSGLCKEVGARGSRLDDTGLEVVDLHVHATQVGIEIPAVGELEAAIESHRPGRPVE